MDGRLQRASGGVWWMAGMQRMSSGSWWIGGTQTVAKEIPDGGEWLGGKNFGKNPPPPPPCLIGALERSP